MAWTCDICGVRHGDLPICFSIAAPWRALVPEGEFAQRVDLSADQCTVDDKDFFVRGHIEIPVHGHPEPLAFSVWASLSEKSFSHISDRWDSPDRAADAPYFGWLCSQLNCYPSTMLQKLSVQSREPGRVPHFLVEPTTHPLAVDQHNGITIARWHQLAYAVLQHEGS